MSFVARLRHVAEQAQRSRSHPWAERLRAIRGTVGPDRVERISVQQLAQLLALTEEERTPATWRLINAAMGELGWTSARFRTLSNRGHREQVRGFARPAKDEVTRQGNAGATMTP